MNGRIINYSKFADDVGVDTKTVQSYFSILEDTLIGFILPAFHRSVRKQQRVSPKFYFFDTGVDYLTIEYIIPDPGRVKLSLHDVSGRMIRSLFDGSRAAGTYRPDVIPRNVPVGCYFVCLQTNNRHSVKRIIIG